MDPELLEEPGVKFAVIVLVCCFWSFLFGVVRILHSAASLMDAKTKAIKKDLDV